MLSLFFRTSTGIHLDSSPPWRTIVEWRVHRSARGISRRIRDHSGDSPCQELRRRNLQSYCHQSQRQREGRSWPHRPRYSARMRLFPVPQTGQTMLMSYFLYRVSSNQPEAQRIYELLIPATEFGEFEFSRTFWRLKKKNWIFPRIFWHMANFKLNFPHFFGIRKNFNFPHFLTVWRAKRAGKFKFCSEYHQFIHSLSFLKVLISLLTKLPTRDLGRSVCPPSK